MRSLVDHLKSVSPKTLGLIVNRIRLIRLTKVSYGTKLKRKIKLLRKMKYKQSYIA